MSKFTEWRDETKASIAAWWTASPMARAAIYGAVAGAAFVAILWVAFG